MEYTKEQTERAMKKLFMKDLPTTLWLDHYSLAQKYGASASDWRQFLKENEQFISSETAAIAEANARKALNSLGNGATTQEVTAIKALLEKSKLVNDAQKQQQQVLITYLPTKGEQSAQEESRLLHAYIERITELAHVHEFKPKTHTLDWYKKERERE